MSTVTVDLDAAPATELIDAAERIARALAGRPAPEQATASMIETGALGRVLDLVETAISARVRGVDTAGEARRWGHPSTSAWLRACMGSRHHPAAERLTAARELPRLPAVTERLASADIGFGHAAAIARGVRDLDEADTRAAEEILLEMVDDGASVPEVARACTRIGDVIAERDGHADPAARPPAGQRDRRRSWLSVSTDADGRGAHVTGWLTAQHASLLRQACAPLTRPAGPGDTRNHGQRFADALHARLSDGGNRWNATLVIDWHTLAGEDDRRQGDTAGSLRRAGSPARSPVRAADGLAVSPEQARQIALNAGISALLLGPSGRPLYLGRQVRLVSSAQRKALLAQYETCVAEGCEIPAYLCEIDHVRAWSAGGPTDLDNLAPECGFHNRFKAENPGLVTMERREGRWRYRIRGPSGPAPRPARRPANTPAGGMTGGSPAGRNGDVPSSRTPRGP